MSKQQISVRISDSLLAQMKVIDYTTQEDVGIIISILTKSAEATCPRCGTRSQKLHQNHHCLVRDLPSSGQEVYLKVNRRQFKCQKCKKPFSESLNFLNTRRSYTKRLAYQGVRFHIMKAINIELDGQGTTLKRKALASKKLQHLEVLKNSKYALLKTEETLTEKPKEKLKEVKKEIPVLGKMQEIKEEFLLMNYINLWGKK